MNFKLQDVKLDLGVTPIENMFLNTFIQSADGDALKVYLLILKDIYNEGYVDTDRIRKQLDFDDEKLSEAIEFWINMGLFREKRDELNNTYIEIVSLRQSYFGDSTGKPVVNDMSFDKASRKTVMFDNIERIIDRSLTPADITRIQETIEEYNSDPELVTEAFRQAKKANNVDVKYVMGFLKTWRDQNIRTLNDLRIHEQRQTLLRKNSPRQYKRKEVAKTGESYSDKKRRERIKKMLEEGNHES